MGKETDPEVRAGRQQATSSPTHGIPTMTHRSRPLALFNGSYMGPQPTGIGVGARDLAAALSPHLVRPLIPPQVDGRTPKPGDISIPANLSPAAGHRGHWRRLRWTQRQLPRLMREQQASLLLSPLPEAPLLQGVRSVVLAHDLLPLRYPKATPLLAYHLAYVPFVLHQAARVLCNSEATAREVHHRLRVPACRIVPIRLGFNPHNLHPLHRPREPFFLVLGSHFPHKNLARVLRALATLPGRSHGLHLVGPHDRRYTPRLQRLAGELGIAERCRWTHWVSDAERLELLNRCQALVIASLWEGFGLPALEAMACGTPVIASSTGALPEVVGDVGLLVDPTNTAEISSAMARAIHDQQWMPQAESQGPSRAALFNWGDTAKLVENILLDLS